MEREKRLFRARSPLAAERQSRWQLAQHRRNRSAMLRLSPSIWSRSLLKRCMKPAAFSGCGIIRENPLRPFYCEFAWAFDLLIDRPVQKECRTIADWFVERGVVPGASVLDAGC